MPICEADPWRLQYFERAACPPDVNIPTEDSDAWLWYPKYRWVYDKLAVALSQGLVAAPHGVPPPAFPVFSKPTINLKGMGIAPAGIKFDNTGHHHLIVDADAPADLSKPLPADEHNLHFGKGQTETTLTLPPGKHTLQLLLADALHTPHEPAVMSKKITIVVE